MASIVEQNPKSTEIQSPLIAGLSEGLNRLSAILNLKTAKLVDAKLMAVAIDNNKENKNRIYEIETGKKLWLRSPAVVVKKNGTIISPTNVSYTIDHLGGSITFSTPLLDGDEITVSADYITGDSTTINTITNNLQQVKSKAERYKGSFDTEGSLSSAFPQGTSGDIAFVEAPQFAIYAWDEKQSKWRNTQSIEDLESYATKAELNSALEAKENLINGDGNTKSYLGGDKKWHNVDKATRDTKLEGFSDTSDALVNASDSVLIALGKLQGQAKKNADGVFLTGTGAPTTSTKGAVGQRYTNTSNGDTYVCASASGSSYTWNKLVKADGNKVLSDNNYTNVDKSEVEKVKNKLDKTTFENFQTSNTAEINKKVDKDGNKSLTDVNFSSVDKETVDSAKTHISSKNNPHNVTPSQIGALSADGTAVDSIKWNGKSLWADAGASLPSVLDANTIYFSW